MVMSNQRQDREQDKFEEVNSKTTVRTSNDYVDKFNGYLVSSFDESVAGTVYVLRLDTLTTTKWLMTRIVTVAGINTVTYASLVNNASKTTTTAWTDRATLTYGLINAV